MASLACSYVFVFFVSAHSGSLGASSTSDIPSCFSQFLQSGRGIGARRLQFPEPVIIEDDGFPDIDGEPLMPPLAIQRADPPIQPTTHRRKAQVAQALTKHEFVIFRG